MKIVFLTRIDSFSKFGGDTYQLQMYKKELEKKGHVIEIANNLNVPSGFDFYIIVNLDRPLEFIIYYNKLKKMNLLNKTLILSIHHSYEQINFYENNYRKGLQQLILNMNNNFHSREKIKNLFRGLLNRKLFKYAFTQFFLNVKKIQRESIERSSIIAIAEGEIKEIEKDYQVTVKKFGIVKNGVNLIEDVKNIQQPQRDIEILVAGRIEPRKNTLSVAEYFKDKKIKVCFVGGLNENFSEYTAQFEKIVGASDHLEYLGKVTPDEMRNLYLRSKIHLSCSWFEVASLVDLEAYAYGCHTISSQFGHTKDYLNDRIFYINPNHMEVLDEMIQQLLSKDNDINTQFNFISENYTWKMSTQSLEKYLKEFNA